MSSFGDDSLLLERFIETARHIEVQVIGDTFGTVINASDRDCSLQRRHQKVVEEAPAPNLPDNVRASMLNAAVDIARSVNYTGVGTVEFVVDALNPLDHFFLEMNTRLQVEHPVTEMVTGLDLVELQLLIAAGEPLPITQSDVRVSGHAVEARVYAEDGNHNFMPSSGRLVQYSVPDNVRVDSGVRQGDVIGTNYDPLLFKVIAHADTRSEAFMRMDTALHNCVVLGVANNISVLRALVQDSQVRSADLNTGLIESLGLGQSPVHPSHYEIIGAALVLTNSLTPMHPSTAWEIADGWRVGKHAETSWSFTSGPDFSSHVSVTSEGSGFWATVDDSEPVRCSIIACPPRQDCFSVVVNDLAKAVTLVIDGSRVLVGAAGSSWELNLPAKGIQDDFTSGERSLDHVRSPMPGTVVVVEVKVGDSVTKGTVLAVVEAMKMEYSLIAPHDGVVLAISAQVGSSVAKDAVLAEVGPTKVNP
jgi:acetyl-CoA/propionyl-CoA carboxylase biotin carboxyl carrier protein